MERTGMASRCFFCDLLRRYADPDTSAPSSDTLALPLYVCATCQCAFEVGALHNYAPGLPPDLDAFFAQLARRAGKRHCAVRPHEVPFAMFVASAHGDFNNVVGHSHAASDCVVCGDEFAESLFYLELRCGHRFHKSCLKPWLETSRSCPTCRQQAPTVTTDIKADDLLRLYPGTDLRRIYETLCYFMATDEAAEAVHGLNVLHCYVGDAAAAGDGGVGAGAGAGAGAEAVEGGKEKKKKRKAAAEPAPAAAAEEAPAAAPLKKKKKKKAEADE